LAFQLNQHGIPGTFALLGGTVAWKNAGYPMESSQSGVPQLQGGKVDPPAN
jgi:3-mercaptopyruvate sulfurtransferase SseA